MAESLSYSKIKSKVNPFIWVGVCVFVLLILMGYYAATPGYYETGVIRQPLVIAVMLAFGGFVVSVCASVLWVFGVNEKIILQEEFLEKRNGRASSSIAYSEIRQLALKTHHGCKAIEINSDLVIQDVDEIEQLFENLSQRVSSKTNIFQEKLTHSCSHYHTSGMFLGATLAFVAMNGMYGLHPEMNATGLIYIFAGVQLLFQYRRFQWKSTWSYQKPIIALILIGAGLYACTIPMDTALSD